MDKLKTVYGVRQMIFVLFLSLIVLVITGCYHLAMMMMMMMMMTMTMRMTMMMTMIMMMRMIEKW